MLLGAFLPTKGLQLESSRRRSAHLRSAAYELALSARTSPVEVSCAAERQLWI